MKLKRKIKLSLLLLIILVIYFGGQYFYLSYKVNKSDLELYNNWIHSLEMTHFFLNKALNDDINEPPDTIIAVQMYYRAQGQAAGIINSSIRESLNGIQGRRLNDKMTRLNQVNPEREDIEKAAEALDIIFKYLPKKKVNRLNEIDRKALDELS